MATGDPQEITIQAAGIRHAAKAWGNPDGRRILALHGWLDSAATWDRLAPLLLAERDVYLVALDVAGHGRSQHRGPDGWYSFEDYVYSTLRVLDALGWDECSLLGHSMGGSIASLSAAVEPERFTAVALVEGLAPMTNPPEEALDQIRRGVQSLRKYSSFTERVLPSFEAIRERFAARPWRLSEEAIDALVRRGAQEVEGGWGYTHDLRLQAESLSRLTPGQVVAYLQGIRSPTLIVVADDGIPYPKELARRYLQAIDGIRVVQVPGRHHVHLDTPEIVLPAILELLDHTAPSVVTS